MEQCGARMMKGEVCGRKIAHAGDHRSTASQARMLESAASRDAKCQRRLRAAARALYGDACACCGAV